MSEIILTVKITGEAADSYLDVCDELIFEDFVGRFNGEGVNLVEVLKS